MAYYRLTYENKGREITIKHISTSLDPKVVAQEFEQLNGVKVVDIEVMK